MLRMISIVCALLLGASLVYAQSTAIAERKDILKGFGAAARDPGAMLKGEAAFDLAKVQNFLKVLQDGSPKLKALFPADSKSGGETKALPAIWDNQADFFARFDKLAVDAKAAEVAIKDEASFKTELPKVLGNCGGCHRPYRGQ
ncbi:MAG: hypothetical protein BVN32_14710 [Proteobacteria bacterium ST_bin14]|nr:cytochrome c [Hyphomicrobiales bacterium]OQW72757.1 MAG: hypothetical protein BVN32_14710 [Proteobacteria bacterium ST_bin14]